MITVGIITASDKGSKGEREDLSGALIKKTMIEKGYYLSFGCKLASKGSHGILNSKRQRNLRKSTP